MTTTSIHASVQAGEPDVVRDALGPLAAVRLAEVGGGATFAQGDVILRERVTTPWLGIVESGRVALRLHVPERGTRTILTVEAGELLGWSAIVPPYRATSEAVAVEATQIRFFPGAELRERIEADRDLAAEVLPVVLRVVSDRLTVSWQQLLDLFEGGPGESW